MAVPPFKEDFLQKLVAIHFPTGNIAALRFNFDFESLASTVFPIGVSTQPNIGMGNDFEAPIVIKPPPKIPSGNLFWAYAPNIQTTSTSHTGAGNVVDRGTYYPNITYIKHGQQQNILIKSAAYGSENTALPLLIDHTGNTSGGAFNDVQASKTLADFQEFFSFSTGLPTVNATWILNTVVSSHNNPTGGSLDTMILGKGLHLFNLNKIKSSPAAPSKFQIVLAIQGHQASNQVDASWDVELTTWKKVKSVAIDGDFFPTVNSTAQQVSDVLISHTYNETTIPGFTVTFSIDLKSLQATGQSVPPS